MGLYFSDRRSPLQGEGRGFESLRVHQTSPLGLKWRDTYISRINSAGRVPSLQVGSRRSESCIRDHWSAQTLNEARCLLVSLDRKPTSRERSLAAYWVVLRPRGLSLAQIKGVVSKV